MKKKAKKNIISITDVTVSIAQKEFIKAHGKKIKRIRIYQIIILILFIGIWELLADIKIIDSFVFSSPSRIVSCFLDMSGEGIIFYHMGVTLLETFLSFFLVIVIGLVTAVVLWWNESISKVLEPYLVVLNSLPKSALAPVFIVWLGNNMKTIIVAAVSVAKVIKVQ